MIPNSVVVSTQDFGKSSIYMLMKNRISGLTAVVLQQIAQC